MSEPGLPPDNTSEIDDLAEDIESSLASLSHLGTTIRKYSTTGRTAKIRKFAEQSNLQTFESLARVAIDALYMDAEGTLRAQLTRSMVETCASILYKKSHQHKMNTNRSTQYMPMPMPTIREERDDSFANSADIENSNINDPVLPSPKLNQLRPYVALESTPSILDSLRTTVLRNLENPSRMGSNCSASSIQLGKVSYPRASGGKDSSSYRTCEWCLEKHPNALFDNKKQWSAHLDKDFEPYVCLSEGCMAEIKLPSFATFKEWFHHMNALHTVRWQQEIHRPTFWVCNFNHKNEYFSSQEKLHEHMKQCYPETLATGLPAIVKNSHTKRSRSRYVCPLCCRDLVQDKRRKRQSRKTDRKRQKVEDYQGNVHITDTTAERDNSGSDDRETESQEVIMARHIAEHLQISMFLTMRLIECQQTQRDSSLENEESSASNTGDHSTLNSELSWSSQALEVAQPHFSSDEVSILRESNEREQANSPDTGIIGDEGNNNGGTTFTLALSESSKYTIGWICDSPVGFTAAKDILSEEDDNKALSGTTLAKNYFLGRVGEHYVAVSTGVHRPSTSPTPIMARMMALLSKFPRIKIILLVGIGHIVRSSENDIHIGDVVVGVSDNIGGGVVQYDLHKSIDGQYSPSEGASGDHPTNLRRALGSVMHRKDEFPYKVQEEINGISMKQRSRYALLDGTIDQLKIHYGRIGSGHFDIREAHIRDILAAANRILCFETDAAGLMSGLPCLVIRGIGDYRDPDTDSKQRRLAAIAAAIFAKTLLLEVFPGEVEAETEIAEILSPVDMAQTQPKADSAMNRPTDSLSDREPSTSYLKALMEDQKDGCSWFLNSYEFGQWQTTKNSFIWLLGGSGCGKTVLSSAVVQKLQRDQGYQPIYFFFNSSSKPRNTLANAIHSLCLQLHNINTGDSTSRVGEHHDPSWKTGTRATLRELIEKFLLLVQRADEIWLILDAIDKCERSEWEALFIWIERIRKLEQANVHFLLTSLPECDQSMAKLNILQEGDKMISIENQPRNDITKYIYKWIIERAPPAQWLQYHYSYLDKLYDVLGERTVGKTTWGAVACQVDALGLGILTSPEDLLEKLKSLPRGQDRMYARILQNIPDRFRPQVTALLHLLTYFKRALGIEEAIEFIKITTSPPYFNLDDKTSFNGDILRYCSSLGNT
ncbi:hypothetical protein TWF718_002206 [Orbilia javanica]|uniref:Nephrocystin 3-like N-terminal domain-containing protein n=1 Tax=Orbilia javanica TaxID=47235 RepID=A0AAN8MM47_9PEZI